MGCFRHHFTRAGRRLREGCRRGNLSQFKTIVRILRRELREGRRVAVAQNLLFVRARSLFPCARFYSLGDAADRGFVAIARLEK